MLSDAYCCSINLHSVNIGACERPLCSAEEAVEVPLEAAWALWDDREAIPSWMPWIKSVKVCQTSFQAPRFPVPSDNHKWGAALPCATPHPQLSISLEL